MTTVNSQLPNVAAIGEVMVELFPVRRSGEPGDHYGVGFAGDTFNTAVGLARLGVPTTYVTLLGDDPFSDRILALMREEGIGEACVERLPGRQPGLYIIANSASGERSFRYWRGESPARELWAHDEEAKRLEERLFAYPYLYLSGITLAIMQPRARQRLTAFLRRYRHRGGRVMFDSNYRARLWSGANAATTVMDIILNQTDIALLTLEDEQALRGNASVEKILEGHRKRGIEEVVIKQGSGPVLIRDGEGMAEIPVPPVDDVVDTTGAGDAFNAGYLAGRLQGGTPAEAAAHGNRAAAAVIRSPGGVVDRAYFLGEMSRP